MFTIKDIIGHQPLSAQEIISIWPMTNKTYTFNLEVGNWLYTDCQITDSYSVCNQCGSRAEYIYSDGPDTIKCTTCHSEEVLPIQTQHCEISYISRKRTNE